MNATTNHTETLTLTWTGKTVWGSVGKTYYASFELDGADVGLTIDQPRKGHWTIRGWADGDFAAYRDGFRTLKTAKAAAEGIVVPSIRRRIADRKQEDIAAASTSSAGAPCACSSPVHTMNCGIGARPTTVRKAGA